MAGDQHTKYTVYLGRAAADLDPITSTELQVIIPELTPAALSGSFAPGSTPSKVQLNTLSGGTVSAAPTTANHIKAIWQGTSNYAYPPYVRAGEQVEVVQYGDSDRYYWRELGRDRELRQLDRLRIEVSATPSKNSPKSDTNTYFFELNAVDGYIQIKTSKANNEQFAYAMRIDTKNSTVLISDDTPGTPNRIYLDSGANGGVPKVQLNNAKNATLSLVGEDIIMKAPRDILVSAGRQLIETAPVATLNWKIGSIVGTQLGVTSSNSMVVKAPTFDVIGNSKTTGMAAAATMRSGGYFVGTLGATPNMPTTTPTNGTGAVGNNPPDTTQPSVQRHAAAYEQVVTMMSTITGWFQQVEAKVGVPSVDATLTNLAKSSEMTNNAGT